MELDPFNTPALRPPDGVVPMFRDHYPLEGPRITLVAVLFLLSAGGVIARSYTRAYLLKQFDFSDWSLIFALLLFAAFAVVKLISDTYGQGHHQWNINVATMRHYLLTENVLETLYCPTMLFAKITVLRQIEVIFYKHQHKRLASRVIWGLIVANAVFYLSVFITFLLACVPRAKIADSSIEGHCIDTNVNIVVTSVINVISGLIILIIPLVAVWQLQMRLRLKFGVAAAFCVGIFATTACAVRLYYSIRLTLTEDRTWVIEHVAAWAMVEFTTIILVACVPLFPRLYKEFTRQRNDGTLELVDNYVGNRKRLGEPCPGTDVDGSSTMRLFGMAAD